MRQLFCLFLAAVLSAPVCAQNDPSKMPVAAPLPDPSRYSVTRDIQYSETEEGRALLADIFLPAQVSQKRPLVIFLHGGGGTKELGQAQSLGALFADAGMAGMVFSYRLRGAESFQTAAADVRAAVDYVRLNAHEYSVDKDRVCLWMVSAGGVMLAPLLADQPSWLRCVVIYYGAMGPASFRALKAEVTEEQAEGLDPLAALKTDAGWKPAIFVAEAGTDRPSLNRLLREFANTAADNAWPVEYWNHPTGPHGFDVFTADERTRQIIQRSLDFVTTELREKTQ